MRPNIIYIHSHDTGRYVQPYGHDVPTPNIQALAERGMLFRQAFCAAPTCSPSRAAMLTGQSAHNSGMLGLAHRGFALNDYSQHLVATLNEAGYETVLAGFQHVAEDTATVGYRRVLESENIRAASVAPAAAAFLESEPHPEPFFLDVGFHETHLRFPEVSDGEARYCRPPAPLPDTPETRLNTAGFKESARLLDDGVGVVLEALEASGYGDNTLVICTTDHGIAFPGMKCNLTDHGMGVMLIMCGPGGFEGGLVSDALVSHIDLFPTLCDLLDGIESPPPWLQGRSLMPHVRAGGAGEVNEEVFSEVTYHAAYEPQRAVRTRRWKYIRRFDEERSTPVLPNCDESPSKDVWLEHGWRERRVDGEQLYDLVFDPNEAYNIAGNSEARAVLEEMRLRLQNWMKTTDDPLLLGPVSAPPGARINDADGMSPGDKPRIM